MEGFEYIIKVNTSGGKHFKDLEEKSRKEMFCIEINKIIESQMHRDEKLARADDIVDNSGSLESLFAAVDNLHTTYCNMADLHSDRT